MTGVAAGGGHVTRATPAGRTYVRQTSVRVGSGKPLVSEVTDVAAQVAVGRVHRGGGRRPGRDRDARVPGIGDGTIEIMSKIIAKQLGV